MKNGSEKGSTLVFLLIFLGLGILVASIRYVQLGDLRPSAKIVESAVWGMAVLLVGVVFSGTIKLLIGPAGESSRRPDRSKERSESRAVKPEELNEIEGEADETERPSVEGVKGQPPEELADVIRKMSESDNA